MKKIFLLHGWTYSLDKWNPLIKLLTEKKIQIVTLNIPGLTEDTNKVWDLDMYIDWLKGKLINEKDIILLGHSNGGRIGLAYAAKYPTSLSKLILIDCAGIYHNELPLQIKRLLFGIFAKIGKKLTSSETLRKLLYNLARENDYKNANPIMRQTMANLITQDLKPELSKIKTSTLIIWGKKDTATPYSDGLLMHKLIPNSKLVSIDNAGHSPHFTHSEEVRDAILSEL